MANALSIGDVYYVDLANGADGSSGEDWDHAMLTIDATLDMCTAGKNDYIVVRGPHDTAVAVAETLDTIDVDGVHVIGFSGAMNPYTPGYAQRRRSTAANLPTVLISASDVEYAGWEVQGQMDGTAWSMAEPKAPLKAGLDTQGTERVYIHNVSVRDPGYTSMEGGIALANCHYPVLEQVSIRSVGNIDYGLQLLGGVGPCLQGIIKDCIIGGGGLGLMATGIWTYTTGQNLEGFTVDNVRFPRVTNAVALDADYDTWATFDKIVAGCAHANIFTGGTAAATRANLQGNFELTAGVVYGNNGEIAD